MDPAASYKTITHLFERFHSSLQRLKGCTCIPLTVDLTKLLVEIMAQLLSILAFSTKMMTENRISGFNLLS